MVISLEMMKWKEFLPELLREFRLSSPEFEELTGVSNVTVSNIKNGVTSKPSPNTIRKIEKALNILIDDSNPDNITYTRLESHNQSIGSISQTGNGKNFAGNIAHEFNVNENSSPELIAYLRERIEKLELELIECRKQAKNK